MSARALAGETTGGSARERLRAIIKVRSYREGEAFKLSSGQGTTYFFDMKRTMLDPEGGNLVADAILALPELDGASAIGGLAVGAVPIVALVSAKSYGTGREIPGFFVRQAVKGHGTNQTVDGCTLVAGARVVLVEDVTTTGGSVMKAVHAARAAGCVVDTVVTIVDRLEGAAENLAKEGIRLVPIFTRDEFSG